MEGRKYPRIKTVAIIAEGVPEQQTKDLLMEAEAKKVGIIGPVTVGDVRPGGIRIGYTDGMLNHIGMSRGYEWSLGRQLTQLHTAVYGMAYATGQRYVAVTH
eukprot:8837033-Alexandrium_andersonii.AAC.1